MNTTLIVGIETLSGRYLADSLAHSQRILGVSLSGKRSAADCDFRSVSQTSESDLRLLIDCDGVDRVIYCGEAAESSWEPGVKESRFCSDGSMVAAWGRACEASSTSFVFLSSDSVFDGPWMFHAEESESFSETPRAHSIRSQEEIVSQIPRTLIVRTHLVGFAPHSLLTHQLYSEAPSSAASTLEHATPLYAGRFATLLKDLLKAEPTGIIHLGGGERISRSALLSEMGQRFGGTVNFISAGECETSLYRETSLRSSRAKTLLSTGLPDIGDLLDDIAADLESGLAERFAEVPRESPAKVA